MPEPEDVTQNLARGKTYLSITDGKMSKTRTYEIAGRGRPDRARMSLNALELVRLALLEGIG